MVNDLFQRSGSCFPLGPEKSEALPADYAFAPGDVVRLLLKDELRQLEGNTNDLRATVLPSRGNELAVRAEGSVIHDAGRVRIGDVLRIDRTCIYAVEGHPRTGASVPSQG